MSHGVTTDVVPFQAYLGHGEQSEGSILCMLCEPACWLEFQYEDLEVEHPVLSVLNGWSCSETRENDDIVVTFGKKSRLYGYQWSKGDYRVICWNSSQYNNGGDLEGSVAADVRASIEAFLADFKEDLDLVGFAGQIQEDDTAEMWG